MKSRLYSVAKFWDAHWGDCPSTDKFCYEKSKSNPPVGIPLFFFNVFFRSVTQIGFLNNPYCGLVIFITFFISNPPAGIGCLVCGGIATAAEMMLHTQPESKLRGGVSPFCASVIGSVAVGIATPEEYNSAKLWILIVIAAIASLYVSTALDRLLTPLGSPHITAPFNICITIMFFVLRGTFNQQTEEENFDTQEQEIDWIQVLRGCVLSAGNVFAPLDSLVPCAIIALAILVSNPLIFFTYAFGVTLNCFLAAYLVPASVLPSVYMGLWGYNGALIATALGSLFSYFSPKSMLLAGVGVVSSVFVQYALRLTMSVSHSVPVFSWPFVLPALLLFLARRKKGETGNLGGPTRVELCDVSYPEKQAWINYCSWKKDHSEETGDKGTENRGYEGEETAPRNSEQMSQC